MQNIKIDGRRNTNYFVTSKGTEVRVLSLGGGCFEIRRCLEKPYIYCGSKAEAIAALEAIEAEEQEAAEVAAEEQEAAPAIDMAAPVAIYKNLHNGLFSVKQRGLVVAHVASVTLTSVTLKVSEAGRQRVLRDKQKNVHAYVVGMIKDINKPCDQVGARLSYNPYKAAYFTWCDNGRKAIIGAGDEVYCDSSMGLFIAL